MKLSVEIGLEIVDQVKDFQSQFAFIVFLFDDGDIRCLIKIVKVELSGGQIAIPDSFNELQGGQSLIAVNPSNEQFSGSFAIVNVSEI